MVQNNTLEFTYFAFISYKREDEKWAKWLQKKLESYGFPVALRKDNPGLPSRIRPIFRDQSELSGGNLKEEIEKGLKGSKYLIVICSPRSAQSPWVSKEVQHFIDNGRENNIIPFIIGGIPNAKNPEDECFPEGLRQVSGEKEILGININEMGRDAAAIKVIARMFGLRFDTLWQRHERAKRRLLFGWGIIAAIVIAAITAVAIFINSQNLALESKNLELKQANDTILAERDRANLQTKLAELERDRANEQTKIAKKERNNALKANQELAESNRRLAEESDNVKKANHEMLKNRARWVSNEALKLIASGDVYRGIALILKVQPLDSSEPFVPEIERALRTAQDSLDNRNSPLCVLKKHNGCVYSAISNSDWKYIVTGSNDNTVRFWDTKTGQEVEEYRLYDYKYNDKEYMALSNNNLFIKRIDKSEYEMTVWKYETAQLGVWKIDINGPEFVTYFPIGYWNPSFNQDGSVLTLEAYSPHMHDDTYTVERIHYNTSNWNVIYLDSIQKTNKLIHKFNNLIIKEDYPVIHVLNTLSNTSFDLEGRYDGMCHDESIIMTHHPSEGTTYLSFWNLDGVEIVDKRIYLPSDIRVVIEEKPHDNLFIGTGNGVGYIYKHPFLMKNQIWRKIQDNKTLSFHRISDYRMVFGKLNLKNPNCNRPKLLSQDGIWEIERYDETSIMITNTANNKIYIINDAHDNRITSLSTVNDKIISTSLDHTVKIWDLVTGLELSTKRKVVNGGYYTYGIISNDNKYMATSNGDQIYLYNYDNGILLQVIDAPDLIGLTFSEDSSSLIYKSDKDELDVHNKSQTHIWEYKIKSFKEILETYKYLRNFKFSEEEKREYLL